MHGELIVAAVPNSRGQDTALSRIDRLKEMGDGRRNQPDGCGESPLRRLPRCRERASPQQAHDQGVVVADHGLSVALKRRYSPHPFGAGDTVACVIEKINVAEQQSGSMINFSGPPDGSMMDLTRDDDSSSSHQHPRSKNQIEPSWRMLLQTQEVLWKIRLMSTRGQQGPP